MGVYFTVNNGSGEEEKLLLFLPPAPLGFVSLLFSFLEPQHLQSERCWHPPTPSLPGLAPAQQSISRCHMSQGAATYPPAPGNLLYPLSHSISIYHIGNLLSSRTRFAVCWKIFPKCLYFRWLTAEEQVLDNLICVKSFREKRMLVLERQVYFLTCLMSFQKEEII